MEQKFVIVRKIRLQSLFMRVVYKFLMVSAVVLTSFGWTAWARPALELTQDEVVTEQGADAKQEAFRKAVEDATSKLVSEMLGPGEPEKHADQIKQVMARSEKYILFIKGSNLEAVPEGSRIKVEMKISLDNFEALLREYGLLQSGTKALKLLPVVTWEESDSSAPYLWWDPNSSKQATEGWSGFLASLNKRLKARNVQVVDGLNFHRVPSALQKANLSRDEQIALAKAFDASLILFGNVQFGKEENSNKARLQTELIDMESQHSLGASESFIGPARDEHALIAKLAEAVNEQVKEAEAGGDMNIPRFRLIVQGALSYPKLEQFRKELLTQVLDIRSLKDRLYSPDEVVFEAESSRTTGEVAAAIRRARFSHLKVNARDGGDGTLTVQVSQ